MEATVKKRMNSIKVMFNDDESIINFLADLKDREPLHTLDESVKTYKSICLLYNCSLDGLVILLLYNAPLDFNDTPNKFVLFIYDNLCGLKLYFERWMEQLKEGDVKSFKALNTIVNLIDKEIDIQMKKTVRDLHGK